MTGPRQLCTFELDDLFLGVEVEAVKEVLVQGEMTRVPGAPAAVTGLLNLRGQVVTAIDLRRVLDLAERRQGQVSMNIVLRGENEGVSLLVDEIGDVLIVPGEAQATPPRTLTGVLRELVTAVYKLEGRLLVVLDATRTVHCGTALPSSSPALGEA